MVKKIRTKTQMKRFNEHLELGDIVLINNGRERVNIIIAKIIDDQRLEGVVLGFLTETPQYNDGDVVSFVKRNIIKKIR